MKKELNKWGNSLSFRLPQRMTQSLGWEEGDEIEVDIFGKSIILKKNNNEISTKSEIISTLAASIDYINYEKETGTLDPETEYRLLKTIYFGTSILLENDDDSINTQYLKIARQAIHFALEEIE